MKRYKVGDKFRTNFLSHKPGGCTVIVKMKDGNKLSYNKIKYPTSYIQAVLKNPDVLEAWIDQAI